MNQRESDRKATHFHSRIYDGKTREPVGNLINVSEKGICFFSREIFDSGEEVDLIMDLPSWIHGQTEIRLVGTVRWCAPDANPEFNAIGMELAPDDIKNHEILSYIRDLHSFSE